MDRLWAKVDEQGNIIPGTVVFSVRYSKPGWIQITYQQLIKGNINM